MLTHFSSRPLFLLAALAFSGSITLAQQPQPPATTAKPAPAVAVPVQRQSPPPPRVGIGQRQPGMMQGDMRPGMPLRDSSGPMMGSRDFHGREGGLMGGGFHLGPGGMWWKNPMIVQRLTLTPDQTKKMDDIFQQSRLQLIDLKANVEKQDVMLEPLMNANPVDTAKALTQIDKVAQARADLEKADARMLLGIRAVLTPEQWTKLRDRQFDGGPGRPMGPGGPAGANSPSGGGGGRTRGMRSGGPAPNSSSNLMPPIDLP